MQEDRTFDAICSYRYKKMMWLHSFPSYEKSSIQNYMQSLQNHLHSLQNHLCPHETPCTPGWLNPAVMRWSIFEHVIEKRVRFSITLSGINRRVSQIQPPYAAWVSGFRTPTSPRCSILEHVIEKRVLFSNILSGISLRAPLNRLFSGSRVLFSSTPSGFSVRFSNTKPKWRYIFSESWRCLFEIRAQV